MIHRLRSQVANFNFFLCCLLIFLLVFETRFTSPPWLQVLGRMHPLLLHFPIVLIILYASLVIIGKGQNKMAPAERPVPEDLLLVGSLTAALSALMGLFLSKEGGYTGPMLSWHKWGGALTAVASLVWYIMRGHLALRPSGHLVVSLGMIALVTVAGHFGASVTHGENFVLAPIAPQKESENIPFNEALVFDHLVMPVLEGKCMGCHNSNKAKGSLAMESGALLLVGGKNGPLWDTLSPQESLLLKRIHLPENAKEHMPPQGKMQLTEDEMQVLERWVLLGAPFDLKVASLPESEPLYAMAQAAFSSAGSREYHFDPASPELVQSLNTNYRIVAPVAAHSPALNISFFGREAFQEDQLKELEKISEQVVQISLNKMPLTDKGLTSLLAFGNVEKLNLSFTEITDKGLASLASLTHLQELSLSGTSITVAGLQQLAPLRELRKVFLWNTGITGEEIAKLQAAFPGASFEAGFDSSSTVIKLSAPIIISQNIFFTESTVVKLKHYLKGAQLRYSMDGTEPDSSLSPVYEDALTIAENTTLKVRACKAGWYSSDVLSKTFLRSSFLPRQVSILTQPNKKYQADLEKTLFDRVKGTENHADGRWLGYEGTPMEVLMQTGDSIAPKSVTISCLLRTGSWLMPPAKVEIWYGNEPSSMKLFHSDKVAQPDKHLTGSIMEYYTWELPRQPSRYLKLRIVPVTKLPKWHEGEGKPAWVFVDEILLN